ncbi:Crp/Fnr family transcriptional regulator [Chthonobacter rhizosphaerae]|uniref:Crp/Fnr family transcriptional regulator n=1 Tax=Chthonobacter rhizosphaerae TaxID=2735553 RepID=UPI0015EF91C4|nr:Crp/Fnr family transcriptional regulator [Chthonobacter rhizosphaerae]
MLDETDLGSPLDRLGPDALAVLRRQASRVRLPAGAHAFHAGDPCSAYLWVREGRVRVQLVAESGREIVLYRVAPGESCVLTTSGLFAHEPYAAEGICETDVAALAIPVAAFRDLLAVSEPFRDLVLGDYARRIGDILMTMDGAASRHITERLAAVLLREAGEDGAVAMTHHQLAVELGSAREVVSRTLKILERRGLVTLSRGRITLCDRSALRGLGAV